MVYMHFISLCLISLTVYLLATESYKAKTENLAHSKDREEARRQTYFLLFFSKSANIDVQQPRYPRR